MKPFRLPLASLFLSPALALAAETPPNILFVLSDDQSAAHVACYGNPDVQTPNIDRLAKEGMRFERAYVASPQCVPSRASLMTGRSPVAIDMTRFSAPLPAEYKVYPEILRGAGYFSGVAGRTYHLDGGKSPASRKVYEEKHLETFPDRLDFVKSTGAPNRTSIGRNRTQVLPIGSASKAPLIYAGTTGHRVSSTITPIPGLPGRKAPSGVRVPSG